MGMEAENKNLETRNEDLQEKLKILEKESQYASFLGQGIETWKGKVDEANLLIDAKNDEIKALKEKNQIFPNQTEKA